MTDRQRTLAKLADRVERLKVLIDFGEERSEIDEPEMKKLAADLKASRREIIGLLSNNELAALKKAELDPEECMKVITEPVPVEPTKIEKALADIHRANRQREHESRYSKVWVADKGAELPIGVPSLSELAEHNRPEGVARLRARSSTAPPTASPIDSYLNHRPR